MKTLLRLSGVALAALLIAAVGFRTAAHAGGTTTTSCRSGYADAVIGGEHKCLHAGEFCSAGYESDYEKYGFSCVDGRLHSGGSSPSTTTTTRAPPGAAMPDPYLNGFVPATDTRAVSAYTVCFAALDATVASGTLDWGDGQTTDVGPESSDLTHDYAYAGSYTLTLTCTDSAGNTKQAGRTFKVTGPNRPTATTPATTTSSPHGVGRTIMFARRTQSTGCTRGTLPDRQCSPGAYDGGLTKAVICSASFRTGTVRNVPESEKHAVEVEYGMAPKSYGRTIEIDHIVSLELGGSNDIANLFPEPGSGAANYHSKDRLENRLHDLVCGGRMTLRAAQRGIASNWIALYRRVFDVSP
jgi:hypothetical protein